MLIRELLNHSQSHASKIFFFLLLIFLSSASFLRSNVHLSDSIFTATLEEIFQMRVHRLKMRFPYPRLQIRIHKSSRDISFFFLRNFATNNMPFRENHAISFSRSFARACVLMSQEVWCTKWKMMKTGFDYIARVHMTRFK